VAHDKYIQLRHALQPATSRTGHCWSPKGNSFSRYFICGAINEEADWENGRKGHMSNPAYSSFNSFPSCFLEALHPIGSPLDELNEENE
jgi:hypothetical protein